MGHDDRNTIIAVGQAGEAVAAVGRGGGRNLARRNVQRPAIERSLVKAVVVGDFQRPGAVGRLAVEIGQGSLRSKRPAERGTGLADTRSGLIVQRRPAEIAATAADPIEQQHARAVGADQVDLQIRRPRVRDVQGDVEIADRAARAVDVQGRLYRRQIGDGSGPVGRTDVDVLLIQDTIVIRVQVDHLVGQARLALVLESTDVGIIENDTLDFVEWLGIRVGTRVGRRGYVGILFQPLHQPDVPRIVSVEVLQIPRAA